MHYYKKKELKYRKYPNGYLFVNGVGINDVAFEIWNSCENPSNVSTITENLFKKYSPQSDEEKNMIKSDILECVNDLLEVDLLERV